MIMKSLLIFPCIVLILGCSPEEVAQRTDIGSADACIPDPPNPPAECTGLTPETQVCSPELGTSVNTPKDVGSPHPNWKLRNVQPADCGYDSIYGLEQFRDAPSMMVLLSAGCGFCQRQTELLQQMKTELLEAGHTIHFIIVNLHTQASVVENLTDLCDFPVFQDTESVNAWDAHQGVKDDFYFYDAEGVLQNFISAQGEVEINLSTDEGYNNIKNALLALVAGE